MLKKISEAVTPINFNTTQPSIQPKPPQQHMSRMMAQVQKAVSESSNLIAALECVGAMYGIPATNIIADDTVSGIRVVNDNIIAPSSVKPNGQVKPIMCAIGSVLDYISQRIDDKLDDYHMTNIQQSRVEDTIKNSNPNKGKVINVYEDDNGDEILVYDTGLVDMANTPEARRKVEELRINNMIPSYDSNGTTKAPSYFSEDEDDITTGVDMNASSSDNGRVIPLETTNVANQIQESAYHLNMISRFNNTTHLGYDLLQKHGFDFIKPVESIVQESASKKDKKEDKKSKIRVGDIKYMKFDNSNIVKAVEYFNKARDEQESARNGKMDLNKFINDPNYEKAISCLNKQFDCRINLRFMETNNGKYENTGTWIFEDLKKKITISKSKGFQLGGLPIDIMTYNHYFENSSPEDISLFGQTLVSTICHEIFHNIAYILRMENAMMGMSLSMTMNVAANAKTMKDRRIIITNYVNSLDELAGNNLIKRAAKKKLIKQLVTLSTVQENEALVQEIQKSVGKDKETSDEYIDKLIKKYKKMVRRNTPRVTKHILPVVATAASITASVLVPGSAIFTHVALGFGVWMGLYTLCNMTEDICLVALKKDYRKSNLYEEYYCDLFAAMYKLPKFFFVGPSKKGYVSNDFKSDKIAELAKLEKEYFESIFCQYPTDLERTYAGVKVAKQLLKEKDVDPAMKKYCQWIVDNFSNVEKANIDEMYNTTTFDPKEAEDLDKHLEDLIKDNNIVLTESYIQWMRSEDEVL